MGGRVTLIRSVLESLPTYYFSLYKAPLKVISDLEKIIKKFLWGGSSEVNKINWVAWDRVALPKKAGGLGISKLINVNRASLCKWGWRYKREKDNLWVKVVDAIHLSGSGWSFLPVKKSFGGVWQSLVSVFDKPMPGNISLRKLFRAEVGRGDTILFWLDPWLFDEPISILFPNLFALEVVKTCSVQDRSHGEWLWRHDPETADETKELSDILSALSTFSLGNSNDVWKWLGDQSGTFSVKSAKNIMLGSGDVNARFVLNWCKWTPSKCNLLVWRAEMDRIPTYDALNIRGVTIGDGLCALCRSEVETAEHVFTSCWFSSVLWQKVSLWCRIPPIFAFSLRDLLEVHKGRHIRPGLRLIVHGIIIVSCWCLWIARNKAVFSSIEAKVDDVFSEVKSLGFLWFRNRARTNHILWLDWCNLNML
ncbi:putative reverse transcriptase zinc-binding domain-containing protein [Helianthus annuus]|nr:putative reverse transcriptase zinc-binding domain-containing protein [Helianthus annuus]